MTRLRTDLWDFYRRRKILFPGEDVKEVEDLTPKMFGEPGREKFGPVKASEIKHLIPFCCDLLTRFSTKVGEPRCGHLLVIGECLLEYIMLMRNSPVAVSRADQQQMFDTVLRLCTAWDLAGLHVKPKRHLLLHMVERTGFQGNPSFYQCWMDETLNKVLAAAGRAAHRAVWALRVLRLMEDHRELVAKRPRW